MLLQGATLQAICQYLNLIQVQQWDSACGKTTDAALALASSRLLEQAQLLGRFFEGETV